MKLHCCVAVLTCVLCIITAWGWAQDRITEEDVVRTLNGKPHTAASGQPLGVALHITFSPQSTITPAQANRALSGDGLQANEALYKALIPLARVVEAEVANGSRFVMKVAPKSPLPLGVANSAGQQLVARIEHFLTNFFAIPRERLSLEVTLPQPTMEGPATPPQGSQRWRLEVFRLE